MPLGEEIKTDAETLLKEIETFFEKIFGHSHPDTHAALASAKQTVIDSTATPPAEAAPESAPETAPGAA
jgi:hypothetical protein